MADDAFDQVFDPPLVREDKMAMATDFRVPLIFSPMIFIFYFLRLNLLYFLFS